MVGAISDGDRSAHIKATQRAARVARRLVMEWLRDHPRREDASLAVSELINNVLQHGNLDASDDVVVTMANHSGRVRVAVRQPSGVLARRKASMPPLTAADGRGLAIVDRVSDRWGIDDVSGLEIWFEVN